MILDGLAILKIKRWSELFDSDEKLAKDKFKSLAKKYHPDLYGDDGVFRHIVSLFSDAEKSRFKSTCEIEFSNNKMSYKRCDVTLTSNIYIGETEILESFHDNSELSGNLDNCIDIRTTEKRFHDDFAKLIPEKRVYHDSGFTYFHVKNKNKDLLRLKDVIGYYDGRIQGRHLVWINSALINLVCFLSYHERVHFNISPETVYIHPVDHYVALLGGWQFTKKINEKVSFLPKRTYDVLTKKHGSDYFANNIAMLEQLRLLGREMMGGNTNYPKPVIDWFNDIVRLDRQSYDEYSNWGALVDSLGDRKYVKMNLKFNDLYP